MSPAAPPSRVVVVLLLVGVAAVGSVLAVRFLLGGDGEPVVVAPTPPAASPSPEAAAPVQPEPFKVKIAKTTSQTLGNGRIFGRAKGTRTKSVGRASRQAVQELTRYLTAEFVAPKSRFTARPAQRLLGRRAEAVLPRRQRAALGVGHPQIDGGRTGKATARTIVLHDGREVFAVTVNYRARMKVAMDGRKRKPLVQRGAMVFVPTRNGWRAEMVDVTLRSPAQDSGRGKSGGKS